MLHKSASKTVCRTIAFICLLLFVGTVQADTTPTLQHEWFRELSSSVDSHGAAVATDQLGNGYLTGITYGDLTGTSFGSADTFISKFDAEGNELWTKQFGSPGFDRGLSIAVGPDGSLYTSGLTDGNFGGANNGDVDAFLTKHNPDGELIWSRLLGTPQREFGYSVAVDSEGSPFITGFTSGVLGEKNFGDYDVFLAKFDSEGDRQWVQQNGTWAFDRSYSLTLDTNGNAFLTGHTAGIFERRLGVSEDHDAFLLKYDPSGELLWKRQFGTASLDVGNSVAVDHFGNAYIGGRTAARLGMIGDISDAFLTKYDAAGNLLWTEYTGTDASEDGTAVAVDADGFPYLAGTTTGNLVGPTAGASDFFLSKYDPDGKSLWDLQYGTGAFDLAQGLAIDPAGNALIGGYIDNLNSNTQSPFIFRASQVPEPSSLVLLLCLTCLRFRGKRVNEFTCNSSKWA